MAKILLTGSTGYIGRRLLPHLLNQGHEIICLVRDKRRFDSEDFREEELKKIHLLEGDLLSKSSLSKLDLKVDLAYYLVHSMSSEGKSFDDLEDRSARNFASLIKESGCEQIIYLSGISNDSNLSKHLSSRKKVEDVLKGSGVPLTVLRAAIIIGSGSASFEIIRDLVEKLPVMVAPKWLKTRCQPIAIRNVLEYLIGCLLNPKTFNKTFDIGGPDILTYKEMLMGYAKVRKLKRLIVTVPVLSPRLSSLWLFFVTSTSFQLARSLVDSMRNEVICGENNLAKILNSKLLTYAESVELALTRQGQNQVISSWKDSIQDEKMNLFLRDQVKAPSFGCFFDKRTFPINRDPNEVLDNIWQIGGERGWYYGDWLWEIRGYLDKMVGGVGLRRGRRSPKDLKNGDSLDFWRVLVADRKKKVLLLFAEMKLPGEAWLEFKLTEKNQQWFLEQNATFRPKGIAGRLYWYSVLPFHGFIFNGMAKQLTTFRQNENSS